MGAGAAMDGGREEPGAVPGLCRGPAAGSRGADGTGGMGLSSARGRTPLDFTSAFTSVVPRGKGEVPGCGREQSVRRAGVTWLRCRQGSVGQITPVRSDLAWDRSSSSSARHSESALLLRPRPLLTPQLAPGS